MELTSYGPKCEQNEDGLESDKHSAVRLYCTVINAFAVFLYHMSNINRLLFIGNYYQDFIAKRCLHTK